jgi:serine acetyltransferase
VKAIAISLLGLLLPWALRRRLLRSALGYSIHPEARIGWSIVLPAKLIMAQHSYIGHLTLVKGLQHLVLDEHARIGNLNWVTAFPLGTTSAHFQDQPARDPRLHLARHSAITNRHLIDCTDRVSIGEFSTLAGFRTQVLTHSISLGESRQRAAPVSIGRYCFVGTASVLLPRASLADYCVLGAGSVLNKALDEPYWLVAGTPARPVRPLAPDTMYFQRKVGYVV